MATGRRERAWVLAGLAVYLVGVALVVLTPVSYAAIVRTIADPIRDLFGASFGSGWIEFTANVLLFLPLGFLLTRLLRRPWQGLILAVGLSAAVELVQFVVPSREPSLRDVVANSVGAALGAGLSWWTMRRRDARVTRSPRSATRRAG